MVRTRRRRLLVVLLLAAAGAFALLAWRAAERWWTSPVALGGTRVVDIAPGLRAQQVGALLGPDVGHPRLFAVLARWHGLASHFRAGEYELHDGLSPADIAALFASGRVLLHPVALIEGTTVGAVLATLHETPFLGARVAAGSESSLRAKLDVTALSLEGLLSPDTYLVPKGTAEADVLRLAHQRLLGQLDEAWSHRASGLPLKTPYEALTLASIIEKETGNADERAHIAAVFVNRLRLGMRLQTDPTVIYGLGGRYTGTLHKTDLTTDTPFNTYTREGLPPTPIALASHASLVAALHPADSKDLYFVASGMGDGRHVFSASLAAHNAAVAGYVARHRQKGSKR